MLSSAASVLCPVPAESFEHRAEDPRPADSFRSRPRARSLRQLFSAALLALGRRMYAESIDDGLTGALIREADERSRRDGGATTALEAEREVLFRRLAEAALEEDAPMPGAEAEYEAAREIQRLLAVPQAAPVASRD